MQNLGVDGFSFPPVAKASSHLSVPKSAAGSPRRIRSAEEYRARFRAIVDALEGLLDDGGPPGGADSALTEVGPVVEASHRVVETLVFLASESRASDIHLDFHQGILRIRLRIDGSFLRLDEVSNQIGQRVINSLMTHAGLDLCRKRRPQDGRLTFQYEERSLSMRIATIPTIDGMKVTLRFIGATQEQRELGELGFEPAFEGTLERLLSQPSGVLLFTGPRSSGKSTTMYAALQRILKQSEGGRAIITLEDPVELYTGLYPQIAINTRAGLTYSRALKSVLRHDPDVIMVGEIRGRATAKLVLHSGLTGHLVLSTLHAGRASLVFSRLARMGIDGFLLGSTIRAAVGLRLVRTVCAPRRDAARGHRWDAPGRGPDRGLPRSHAGPDARSAARSLQRSRGPAPGTHPGRDRRGPRGPQPPGPLRASASDPPSASSSGSRTPGCSVSRQRISAATWPRSRPGAPKAPGPRLPLARPWSVGTRRRSRPIRPGWRCGRYSEPGDGPEQVR